MLDQEYDKHSFLRSITVIHAKESSKELVYTEDFWKELLPTWTFLPYQDQPVWSERLNDTIDRLHSASKIKVRSSKILLLEDVDRPYPNECLIAIDNVTKEISIRIFGRYLTDIQSTSEWLIHKLLDVEEHFVVGNHTRCVIAFVLRDERTDLTVGRITPKHHRLWRGFYKSNVYSINITAFVTITTLAIVIFITPADEYSTLGKFYGICERVLSAAFMNIFLLLGSFYLYRKNRTVIEWEKP